MVFFRASFVLLATSLTALSFPLQQRALSDINADFKTLSVDLATLATDLNGLSQNGPSGLNKLQNDENNFVAHIQKATSAVSATAPLDETDSQNLFSQTVEPVAESLVNILELYASEKPTFEDLSTQVPGLIGGTEANLQTLAQVIQALVTALSKINTPDVENEGASLRTSVSNAFADALAAFSG